MYIDYNGLTRRRIVGASGITLVVIGLIIVAMKFHNKKSFLWMVRRQLMAFSVALLLLALTPLDNLVHRYNVPIILSGNHRPAVQITHHPISPEGLPLLIPLLNCGTDTIERGVAGILLRERDELMARRNRYSRWTYTEGSTLFALKRLEDVKTRLEELVPDGNWSAPAHRFRNYTNRWW